MWKLSTSRDSCSVLSKNVMHGRRNSRSVVSSYCPRNRDHHTDQITFYLMLIYQDSEAKFRKSQKELEELEASMQDLWSYLTNISFHPPYFASCFVSVIMNRAGMPIYLHRFTFAHSCSSLFQPLLSGSKSHEWMTLMTGHLRCFTLVETRSLKQDI